MKLGYFPGCSQTGTAIEFDISLRKVTEKLGTGLDEIKDWSCCGATSAHVTNHKLANALAMRNIALAGRQGLEELVAPCAACYNRLAVSQHEVLSRKETKEEIESIIEEKIEKEVRVMNLIELFRKIGYEKIAANKATDLKGMKVACYYGCLLVRPADITKFDDPEQPSSMEEVVELTGAGTVDWNYKLECCGAGHSLSRREIVLDLSHKIIEDAKKHGANVMVVACPMCHTNLDMRQRAMKHEYKEHEDFPVLYLTELIGLSLGLSEKELGIDKHYVNFKYKEPAGEKAAV